MSVGFSVSKYGLGRCPAFLDRNMTVNELGPTIGAFQVAIAVPAATDCAEAWP